jgi:DNA segregation ATPase FtsK/SpoIIIE-like protein
MNEKQLGQDLRYSLMAVRLELEAILDTLSGDTVGLVDDDFSDDMIGLSDDYADDAMGLSDDYSDDTVGMADDEMGDTLAAPEGGGESVDFFAEITQSEPAPDDELYRKALHIIIGLGYASTFVLQRRLEISYRQASIMVAELERDGIIASAPGFRPRKTLAPAYQLLESLETKLGDQRKH